MLVAAGCGGAAEPGAVEGPTTAERLTIALPAAVGGPLNVFVSFQEQVSELVYDKLLAPSPYVAEPQPWLASEVRMVDPSTWDVTVRDDVRWHDGEPFTAEDVAFTFSYARDAPTGRFTHHINEIPDVTSVELLDANRVRFTCAFACPDLGPVTLADLPILPEHVWSQVPPTEAKNHDALRWAPARTGWSSTTRPPDTASRPTRSTSQVHRSSTSWRCRSSPTRRRPSPRCARARSTRRSGRCRRS